MSPRDDAFGEEEKPFLAGHEPVQLRHRRRISNWRTYLPWALTALSWLVTAYVLVHQSSTVSRLYRSHDASSNPDLCPPAPACAQHHLTDLEAMHSIVRYERRHYTGELIYDAATNRIVRNLSTTGDDTVLYFGPPSPAIDEAWHTLLRGEFPRLLSPDETTPFLPELEPLPVDGEFHFEPDVFHSLHCLNAVRTALDREYYEDRDDEPVLWPQEDWPRIHLDHCLDQIRQALMCHGDLSPVPLYSWAGVPLAVGRGGWHTCRDWDAIRDWVDRRNELYKPLGEW